MGDSAVPGLAPCERFPRGEAGADARGVERRGTALSRRPGGSTSPAAGGRGGRTLRGIPQVGARLGAPLPAVRAGRVGRPLAPAAPPAAPDTGRGGGGDLPAAHRAPEMGAASYRVRVGPQRLSGSGAVAVDGVSGAGAQSLRDGPTAQEAPS